MNFFIILSICFGIGYASDCSSLSGIWRNELGSNMTVQQVDDSNRITGRYYTAVESSAGAARLSTDISGMVVPVQGGSLVAFNVLWNKGASLTVWVGQCMVCGGKEKIHTTWVLRSMQPKLKRWMSTRINQDTFWRVQDAVPEEGTLQSATNGLSVESTELLGGWSSNTSDNFNIATDTHNGTWQGVYYTTASGSSYEGPMFGVLDGNSTYHALGFVASAGDNKVKGWTGHIYNAQNANKVIETSWLKHRFENDCSNPRRGVKFGMDKYAQTANEQV